MPPVSTTSTETVFTSIEHTATSSGGLASVISSKSVSENHSTSKLPTITAKGSLTSLSFVGTINARQAQEITDAIKSLVHDYLCESDEVTIESVNYNRNNGRDSTFSALISCDGKLVSRDNINRVIENLPSDKVKEMFPLPLKTGGELFSTAAPAHNEDAWVTNNWGIILAIVLIIVLSLAVGAVYTLRKRRRKTGELDDQTFISMKNVEEESVKNGVYISQTDYIDDTNIRL